MHEAALYSDNMFVTLTYRDDSLPPLNSLRFTDFQLFLKRYRKFLGSRRVRFFHCGEYGETTFRPHYHALFFGHSFDDLEVYSVNAQGHRIYTSEVLDGLWGLGECKVGALTFESAAYVARYVCKRVTGAAADDAYQVIDPSTGEVIGRRAPEYATMSRRPGIGREWYDKFSSEVYPSDFVVRNGVKMLPPKFYDRILERDDERLYKKVRARRKRNASQHANNNTPERLRVREEVQRAKIRGLKRSEDV